MGFEPLKQEQTGFVPLDSSGFTPVEENTKKDVSTFGSSFDKGLTSLGVLAVPLLSKLEGRNWKSDLGSALEDYSAMPSSPILENVAGAYEKNSGIAAPLAAVGEAITSPVQAAKYLTEMLPAGMVGGGPVGAVAKQAALGIGKKLALNEGAKVLATNLATGAGVNAGATAVGGLASNTAEAYRKTGDVDQSIEKGLKQTGAETAVAGVMGAPLNVGANSMRNIALKALGLSPADETLQTYLGSKAIGEDATGGELAASWILGGMGAPADIGGAALFKEKIAEQNDAPAKDRGDVIDAIQKANDLADSQRGYKPLPEQEQVIPPAETVATPTQTQVAPPIINSNEVAVHDAPQSAPEVGGFVPIDTADIAPANTELQPQVEQLATAPDRKTAASSNLIERIKQLGGVNQSFIRDITGEASQKNIPVKGLFSQNGRGLDDLATMLADEGFDINVNNPDDNGGVNQLSELIARAVGGEQVLNLHAQEAARLEEGRKANNDRIRAEAKELGIKTFGKKLAVVDDEIVAKREALNKEVEDLHRQKLEVIGEDLDTAYAELEALAGEDGISTALRYSAERIENENITDGADIMRIQAEIFKQEARLREAKNAEENTNSNSGQVAARTEETSNRHMGGEEGAGANQEGQGAAFNLNSYTNQEIARRDKAAAKASEESSKEPPVKGVTSDQADIFNTQGALFNSNREQQKPSGMRDGSAGKKKLEVLKAQAQGKITSDQGAALKELADAGEHAAVDEVLKPSDKQAEKTQDKQIDDFGEKIGGARKEYAAAYKDRMAEAKTVDVLAQPLSKSWPEPDYQKLVEAGYDKNIVGFDNFFKTIESKETDKGTALFSKSKSSRGQIAEAITQATARLRNSWSGFRKINIVQSVKEIPNDVNLRALRALQPINDTTEGIYDPNTNTVYLIADNIASPERAVWVAAHEVVGHGGIRMLDKSVAEHVDRLSKNGTVEKLAQAIAKDRGDSFDKSIHVQEAIAELAAAHVTGDAAALLDRYGVKVPAAMQDGILGVIARIIEAVRNFMAKVLGQPVSSVSDSEVVSLIRRMKNAAEGIEQQETAGNGYAMASEAWIKETARSSDFLMRAVKALIDSDSDVLKFPHSTATSIPDALNDMFGAFAKMDNPATGKENAASWGGNELKYYGFLTHGEGIKVHTFSTPLNESFSVTEHPNGQIHINVLHLLKGGFGQAVYIGVADYAKNSSEATGKDKVFVADSAGLTDDSLIRRTTNMLSVVARHGTAKFIMPGAEQLDGDARLGVPPLKWGRSDIDKFNALAHTFVDTIYNAMPELKGVHYDYNKQSFVFRSGEALTGVDFEWKANTSAAKAIRAGESSIRRAVFLQSLMDSESKSVGERESILGELSANRISAADRGVDGLFSQAPKEKEAVKLPRDYDIARRILPHHIPLIYGRDELGNIQSDFLGTRRLKDFLHAAFLRPMAVKTGMASATPELAKLMRKQKADIDKALRVTQGVVDATKGMSEEESALISRIVTKEMQENDVPPEHAMKIAAVVERAMTEQGQDAVDLKMLSPDAYEKWKGKYLPRFYMKHLDPEVKSIWQRTFKSRPIEGYRSGSLKGRGKSQVVTVQELPQWESMGWEVADKSWKKNSQGQLELTVAGKAMPNTDTVMIWKDYTPGERKDMGEVEDFRLRFVLGYMSMQRDLAVGRLYKQIAENPEWTRRTASEGFSYVPVTEIPETGGLNRYGMLAGLYVKDEILSHISQHEDMDNEFQRYYKAALSKWKEGKTVLNPVTHMNNFVSNLTMAHFAGVSYWDGEKYLLGLKEIIANAPMLEEGRDAGLFTGDFSHAEIMKSMPAEVRNLVNHATDSAAIKTGRIAWRIASLGLNDVASTAYHWGDVYFKYLIYRDARIKGMSPEDAVHYAGKYIFNYDDLPKTARAIRDYGIPFFAYTYKVIPALTSTAIEYPWRFAAPATVIASINAMMYASMAGDDGEDWWLNAILSGSMNALLNAYTMGMYGEDTPKTAGQQMEQDERKNLAEWDKGSSAMGTQKTIRLGVDEKTGLPVFMNVYRFIPGGDIQDVQNERGGLGIPAPFAPSNPVLNTMFALYDNKNWDGKDMFDINDTGAEKAKKAADFLYKQMLPNVAPGGAHYDRLMQAAANASDTTIESAHPLKDYTGIGNDGLPVQTKYAAMQTVGIKARPVDLERSAAMNQIGDSAVIKSIKSELRSAARKLGTGVISQREYDSIYEKSIAKIEGMKDEE